MPASITLTVSHLPTSTSFFLSCLHPLNYVYRGRVADTIGFGPPDAAPDFWITQAIPGVPPGPAHVAFPATSRGKVHDFFHSALKAGGKVHGEPAVRDDCGYYSAAIIDFDGNSIEAVFRPDLVEASNAGDDKTVVSMTKSVAKSKAPTVVSSASKAKSVAPSAAKSTVSKAPSAAPSKAPSAAGSKAPSAVGSTAPSAAGSKAPSVAVSAAPSKAPSAAPSKAPTASPSQVGSVAPSAAPKSTVSKAPTAAVSEAPARTTISRAPTAPAAPQGSGNNFVDMLNEAKGTVAFAREVVNQARPLVSSPPPAAAGGSPDSHAPSDAIVGTLLGVAAGAALHYAFSNRTRSNEVASAPVTPPEHYGAARSESIPSWSDERYFYYHQQPQGALPAPSQAPSRPYAIEPAPSDFSRASGSRGGQRLIEMVDNDLTLSEVAPSTVRPRRRSSFSGVSAARSSASRAKSGIKMLEGPPTSYRAPTAITMASDAKSHSSRHSRSNSLTRSTSRPTDEGYASATEDRKSRISIRRTGSSTSKKSHRRSSGDSAVTAIKSPEQTPLPASRAASHVDDRESFYSTHSKSAKTVIGRLTEKQLSMLEAGGRFEKGNTDVTKSVIGKIKEVDHMNLTKKELGPEDSVSQVSSSRGSRHSRR